jgi:hypothetical protein
MEYGDIVKHDGSLYRYIDQQRIGKAVHAILEPAEEIRNCNGSGERFKTVPTSELIKVMDRRTFEATR